MKKGGIFFIINRFFILLIEFYQNYISVLTPGSCRYHPTCSAYAKMQFQHNNFFLACINSTLRILRCNPLFDGGFDYVKTKCPKKLDIQPNFKKIQVEYWKIPVDDEYCLIIKHNKKWDKK